MEENRISEATRKERDGFTRMLNSKRKPMTHYIAGLKEPVGGPLVKPWPEPKEDRMTEKTHAGLPVSGYRPQSDNNVKIVNNNKEIEEITLRILDTMKDDTTIDQRWLAIGRTHIEQGFMAVNRAVFKPERIKISADALTDLADHAGNK